MNLYKRWLILLILMVFLFNSVIPPSRAQTVLNLPVPGSLVSTTPSFLPAMIKGINLYPDNPLKFDFIIDKGETVFTDEEFRKESTQLIKYFLASLTVPEDEMWVNLSPYEKNRIVPKTFGETEMGRDLLAQDYMLKQLTASLMNPDDKLGGEFWRSVYAKAQEKYGTTDIPMNTFNKIWIVPEEAVVYEHEQGAFIVKSHLKVMLEEDYLALEANKSSTKHGLGNVKVEDLKVVSGVQSAIIKDLLIPEIEREVNEGKTFANLRQIYNAVILASWYKEALKESVFGEVFVNKKMTKGVETDDKSINEKIYHQYVESFKKGVFDYIKEDYNPETQEVSNRKYFSGGVDLAMNVENSSDAAMIANLGEFLKQHRSIISVSVLLGALALGVPSDRNIPFIDYANSPVKLGNGQIERFRSLFLENKAPIPADDPVISAYQSLSRDVLLQFLGHDKHSAFDLPDALYVWLIYDPASANDMFYYDERYVSSWLNSLTKEEIIQVLVNYMNVSNSDKVKNLKKAGQFLTSAKYKNLLEKLGIKPGEPAAVKNFNALFRANDVIPDLEQIFAMEEFKSYVLLLKDVYGYDVMDDLTYAVDAFLTSERLQLIQSPAFQKAWGYLKKYLNDLPMNDPKYFLNTTGLFADDNFEPIEKIELLESQGKLEETIKQFADQYHALKDRYGIHIKTPNGFTVLFYNRKDLEKIISPFGKELFEYYQARYPNRYNFTRLKDLVGFQGFVETMNAFRTLNITPRELDEFLFKFNLNLGDLDLSLPSDVTAAFLAMNGIDAGKQKVVLDVSTLGQNQAYTDFVSNLFNQYPDLRKKTPLRFFLDTVPVQDYEKVYRYNQLLKAIFSRSNNSVSYPFLDVNHIDVKIQILEMIGRDYPQIKYNNNLTYTIYGPFRMADTEENFGRILESMKNGKAKRLYETLINQWGMDKIDLEDFLLLLVQEKTTELFPSMDFYLDPANAVKYHDLIKTYHLVSAHGRNSLMTFFSIRIAKFSIEHYELLSNPEVKSYLSRYWLVYNENDTVTLESLASAAVNAFKPLSNPRFAEMADYLQKTFALDDKGVASFLNEKEITPKLFEELTDGNFLKTYQQLVQLYSEKRPASARNAQYDPGTKFVLKVTYDLREWPHSFSILHQLRDLGFDITDYNLIEFIKKHLLPKPTLVNLILDPDFIAFGDKATKIFYGKPKRISDIIQIIEIFEVVNKNKEVMDNLFSEKFDETAAYIQRKFFITGLGPSALIPILQIAEVFDEKRFDDIITDLKKFGERITANDLVLLSEALKDPSLFKLLFDRQTLLAQVADVYTRDPAPRKIIDKIAALRTTIDRLTAPEQKPQKEKLDQELKEFLAGYTERPDLSSVSNLQLLRLYLLNKSLKENNVRQSIGTIIRDDIQDKTTEYGGVVSFNRGKFEFINVPTTKMRDKDGDYHFPKNGQLIPGILFFHNHALDKNHSDFSGPSGWWGGDGDISHAGSNNLTGVLITTMGHPMDTNSKEVENQMNVNVDMYFVDKHNPNKVKPIIIDLGVITVPYNTDIKDVKSDKALLAEQLFDVLSRQKAADDSSVEEMPLENDSEDLLNNKPPGGIDLNPALLKTGIKSNGHRVIIPSFKENTPNFNGIQGFTPNIINLTPIINLPFLLGLNENR